MTHDVCRIIGKLMLSVSFLLGSHAYAQTSNVQSETENAGVSAVVNIDKTLNQLSPSKRIETFNSFRDAIGLPLDTQPTLPFNVTYTSFKKKTDKNGEPLVKFKGEYRVIPLNPAGERVITLSASKTRVPYFIQNELRRWETDGVGNGFKRWEFDGIGDDYYCSLDMEIMQAFEDVTDPNEINFTSVPSLPNQLSFNFKVPDSVILSQDKNGETFEENDPVRLKFLQKAIIETTIDKVTSQPTSLRLFIEDPFQILGVIRVRALDEVITCDKDANGALYAKESLYFARFRMLGIAQRVHYLRSVEFSNVIP